MFKPLKACRNCRMVFRAKGRIAALRIVAFSLSIKPIPATSCDNVILTPCPSTERMMSRTCASWSITESIGEYVPTIAISLMPAAFIFPATSLTSSSSTGVMTCPSTPKCQLMMFSDPFKINIAYSVNHLEGRHWSPQRGASNHRASQQTVALPLRMDHKVVEQQPSRFFQHLSPLSR